MSIESVREGALFTLLLYGELKVYWKSSEFTENKLAQDLDAKKRAQNFYLISPNRY